MITLDGQPETSILDSTLATSWSSVDNCDVSTEYLHSCDSSGEFLSTYFDLSAACSTPSPLCPSQTISDPSTSPSTFTSASYPATPYQAHSRYACEWCPAAFNRISLLAEHYKSCHSSSHPGISAQYSCGRCSTSSKRCIDFIRHLRTQTHFNEYHQCRCGMKFQRAYKFRQHVEQRECQGPNVYTCLCGHSVQSYAEALTLVSTNGHIYKCDDPRPQGRPKKNKDEQSLAVNN